MKEASAVGRGKGGCFSLKSAGNSSNNRRSDVRKIMCACVLRFPPFVQGARIGEGNLKRAQSVSSLTWERPARGEW